MAAMLALVAKARLAMMDKAMVWELMVIEATDDAERTYAIKNQALTQKNLRNDSCNDSMIRSAD